MAQLSSADGLSIASTHTYGTRFFTMNDTKLMQALLHLVRCGLWDRDFPLPQCFPLSHQEWQGVYDLARLQTVTGIVFHGIGLLPDRFLPSEEQLAQWMAYTDGLERRNKHTHEVMLRLTEMYRRNGLHPVVMKGQGIAAMYAHPLLRECGDIDLYFPSPDEHLLAHQELVRRNIPVQPHADGSLSYSIGGVVVEHHSTLCDLHGAEVQDLLHRMQEQWKFQETTLPHSTGEFSILVPSPQMHWLVLNSHILKHIIGRGVGLRQLCDMARFCASNPLQAHGNELLHICRTAGITQWTHLLHSCLVDYLALPQECVPMPLQHTHASQLMKIILQGGNFGRSTANPAPSYTKWLRKVNTAACFLRNMGFSLRYAPNQTARTFLQLLKGQAHGIQANTDTK